MVGTILTTWTLNKENKPLLTYKANLRRIIYTSKADWVQFNSDLNYAAKSGIRFNTIYAILS